MHDHQETLLVLEDAEGKAWGVFVYHEGSKRVLYTKLVDSKVHDVYASKRMQSFDGPFDLMVGTDGTLYTYPRNKQR